MSRPELNGSDAGHPDPADPADPAHHEPAHPEPGHPDAARVLLRLALARPPFLGAAGHPTRIRTGARSGAPSDAPSGAGTDPGTDDPTATPAGRLVAIDGPAGSGKTTLAASLATAAEQAGLRVTVVATDDVLRGWDGLPELGPRLRREVVEPLLAGRAGSYRRYDWHARDIAETVAVPLVDLVVLEGVGSGHLGYDDVLSALVWVEAPPALRRARGLARDGEELAAAWDAFVPDEDVLHARERTRERADLLVDGVSGATRVPDAAARRPRAPRRAP